MEKYYQISSLSMEPADVNKSWHEDFLGQYPCGHRHSQIAIDVVVDDLGPNVPLNLVFAPCISFARQDLLETIGKHVVDEFLSLGDLYDKSGSLIEGFRTLGAKSRLDVRGSRKSTRQFCPSCGTFLYFAIGKQYLLKENLTGQPLYYASRGPLIINESVRARVVGHHWAHLEISEIPVLDQPTDGLPTDLRNVKPQDLFL